MFFSPSRKPVSFEEYKIRNLRGLMLVFAFVYPLTEVVEAIVTPNISSPWWPVLPPSVVALAFALLSYRFQTIKKHLEIPVFVVCLWVGMHLSLEAYLNEKQQFLDLILSGALYACLLAQYRTGYIIGFYIYSIGLCIISQLDKPAADIGIYAFEYAAIGLLFLMSSVYRAKLSKQLSELYEQESYDKRKSLAYQQLYEKIGTHLPQGLVLYGTHFEILFINDKAAGNLQYRNFIGKPHDYLDEVHGYYPNETRAALSKVFATGFTETVGKRTFTAIADPDGRVTEVICTIAI